MLELLVDSEHPGSHQSNVSSTSWYHKSIELRVVVGVTSGLSIVGSLLIVFSYLCFKSLRTKAREILMHISFMDFGAAACNLLGIGVNFGQYYDDSCNFAHHRHKIRPSHVCKNVSEVVEVVCMTQGSLASFFTLGSILWTICLSMYLYILISQKNPERAKLFVRFAYFFCYLIPIGILVWMVFTKRIGYSPYESSGWCGTIFVYPHGKKDIYASIIGYNLWICLTFVLVPILSLVVHLYIRDELKTAGPHSHSSRFLSALQKLDYKFLLIPVAFILLRMWSFIGDVLFVYRGIQRISSNPLAHTLMILEGIGDSGQGVANAILFVLFTKKVRERFICCWRHYRCWRKESSVEEQTRRLNESQTSQRHRVNSASYSVEGAYTPPLRDSPYS